MSDDGREFILILIVSSLFVGISIGSCSTHSYPNEIDKCEKICKDNDGCGHIGWEFSSVEPTYEAQCKNGAQFDGIKLNGNGNDNDD